MDTEEHTFSDEEDYNSDLDNYDEENKEDKKKEKEKKVKSRDADDDDEGEDEDNENEDNTEAAGNDKEIGYDEEDDADGDMGADDEEDGDAEGYEEDIILEEETPDDLIEYIVKEEDRITSDCLSKYEIIELISIRATQISKGDYPFTDVKNLRDPISMAKKEIYDNRCPLLVKRGIGNNKFEVWNPNLMFKPKI